MPDALDRIELWAVGRQRQQGNVVGYRQRLAVVPAGAPGLRRGRREDQQGVGRGADLAADLAQMVVHLRWYCRLA